MVQPKRVQVTPRMAFCRYAHWAYNWPSACHAQPCSLGIIARCHGLRVQTTKCSCKNANQQAATTDPHSLHLLFIVDVPTQHAFVRVASQIRVACTETYGTRCKVGTALSYDTKLTRSYLTGHRNHQFQLQLLGEQLQVVIYESSRHAPSANATRVDWNAARTKFLLLVRLEVMLTVSVHDVRDPLVVFR